MKFLQVGFLCLVLSVIAFAQSAKDVFQLKSRIGFAAGNEKILQSVPLDEGNKLLLIGKKEIQLWDGAKAELIRSYPHDITGLPPVAFSMLFFTFPPPNVLVESVKLPRFISPDGAKKINFNKLPGEKGAAVLVWDLITGKQAGVLERPLPVRLAYFTENGKMIVSTHGTLKQMEICVWDAGTFTLRNSIAVNNLSWHRATGDGERIFIATGKAKKWVGYLVLGYEDTDRIEVWNTKTGKLEKTFTADNVKSRSISGSEPVISSDEKFLAARSNNKVIVWDIAGRETPKYEIAPAAPEGYVKLIGFSNDAKYLLTAQHGKAGIYEAATGKLYKEFSLADNMSYDLTPDNKYVITRIQGSAYVSELESEKHGYRIDLKVVLNTNTSDPLQTSETEVESLKVSPSGKFIMVYGDKEVKIYDIRDGKLLQTLADPQKVKYKDSGKIKDNGLDNDRAEWVGNESISVLGEDNRSYFLWSNR